MREPIPPFSRATPKRPCPVCGTGSKGCSITDDGFHLCRGDPARPGEWFELGTIDAAGFRHYRPSSEKKSNTPRTSPRLMFKGHPTTGNGYHSPDWKAKAEEFAKNLTNEKRRECSTALFGLPDVLDMLPLVGMNFADTSGIPCMTFPEMDATGRIIGINRRYPKGKGPDGKDKKAMKDSRRGLTLPIGWRERPGAVYIVEGPTDAAALSACGLSAVGRPSNSGGADLLAELLRDLPTDRGIFVVGENDQKPDGSWPGSDGAVTVTEQLAAKLHRPISVSLPPATYKDVRDWVKDLIAGSGESVDLEAYGAEIVRYLEEDAEFELPPQASPDTAPRFQFINSREFATGNFCPEWLVKRVMVKGQPGVIAGPAKALKTNISIDLAVSLASGTDFLGKFAVYKPVRVAVASGESGEHTLQETARRICEARNVNLAGLEDKLAWCFSLPTFSDAASMGAFAAELVKLKAEVVIIDPTYLALGAIDAKNLFEVGPAFRAVGEQLIKAGATPILNHHANRQLPIGEVMELSHLAYSGLEQYARQFLLLNRREGYRGDGVHNLWLNVGGSCGQGGLMSLHIEEGTLQEDFTGRTWSVDVQSLDDVRTSNTERKAAEKIKKAEEKIETAKIAVLHAIDVELETHEGATERAIRKRSGIAPPMLGTVLDDLREAGIIEAHQFVKVTGNNASQTFNGYRRFAPQPEQPTPDLLTSIAEQPPSKDIGPTEITRKRRKAKN